MSPTTRNRHPQRRGDDRPPPANLDAEQALIGAALLSKATEVVEVIGDVQPEDFMLPAHRYTWDAIRAAFRQHQRVDVVLVADVLRSEGMLDAVGGPQQLLELQAVTPAISNVARYATIVRRLAEARRAIVYLGDLADRIFADPEAIADHYEALLDEVRTMRSDYTAADLVTSTPTLRDVLALPWTKPEWVWPGMLHRGHRLALAGRGGARKSTFFRQGITFAAWGVNPYMGSVNDLYPLDRPQRTLILDMENDDRAWRMEVRRMDEFLAKRAPEVTGNDYDGARNVFVKALGGATYDPVSRRADRADLWARLREAQPDLLYFGPIYKLDQRGGKDQQWHSQAGAIQQLLDEARATFGCAVLLEMHVGKDGRADPRGAADWGYWPELGITISQRRGDPTGYRVQHFRGRRFADLYEWWPNEMSSHVRGVMPFKVRFGEGYLPGDGGPYAWDRPPGWDTPPDPGDDPHAGEPF